MKQIILSLFLVSCVHATERETVAATILAEARGEGEAGMYSVAATIQQRVIERKISAEKVCLQKYQFSCNNKGAQLGLLKTPQAEYALRLADNLDKLDRSYIGFANHYHASGVKPSWAKGKTPTVTIKNHVFYKIK